MKKTLLSFFIALIFSVMGGGFSAYAVEFTAMDGDFKAKLYGEIYADGFYTYASKDFQDIGSSALVYKNGQHSFGSMAFVGSSKLGVVLSYGNVSGTFEAGLGDPVRRFFLTYKFNGQDDHYILFGRDTNIAYYLFGQVSNDGQCLNDYGTMANRRRLQMRYGIKGFEVAVIIPYVGGFSNADDKAYVDDNSDYIFTAIPRIEAAYTYKAQNILFKVFGSYGAYLYKVNDDEKLVNQFNIGFGGKADFGNAFMHFTGFYGQNFYLNSSMGGYYFSNSRYNPINPIYNVNKDAAGKVLSFDYRDVQTAGAAIGFGYNANGGKIVPQIGVGYSANFGSGFDHVDDRLGAFINCQFYINEWFSIIPEVAYLSNLSGYKYKNMTNNENKGSSVVAGAMAVLAF